MSLIEEQYITPISVAQKEFYNNISNLEVVKTPVEECPWASADVRDVFEDFPKIYGKVGVHMRFMFQSLNFEHPDSGKFILPWGNPEKYKEGVSLFRIMEKSGHKEVVEPFFKRYYIKHMLPNFSTLRKLFKNSQSYIRLMKDEKSRTFLRSKRSGMSLEIYERRIKSQVKSENVKKSTKKIVGRNSIKEAASVDSNPGCPVSSSSVKGMFDSVCLDFPSFFMGGNFAEKQDAIIEAKMNIAQTYDMNILKAKLSQSKSKTFFSYYGFERFPLTYLAYVLAKACGFAFFGNQLYNKKLKEMNSSNKELYKQVFNELYVNSPDIKYRAMLYPYCWLSKSSQMEEVISLLDNFGPIGGRPIFDNFLVLTPSFGYDIKPSVAGLTDWYGNKISSKYISQLSYDRYLIENLVISPILLGERENKYYFICFWEKGE